MSSFQKFLSYLEKHPYYPNNVVERLHSLLFCSPYKLNIDITEFAEELGLSLYDAIDLIIGMHKDGVINIEKTECPSCGFLTDIENKPGLLCEKCGAELDAKKLYITVSPLLTDKDIEIIRNNKFYDQDAYFFAEAWEQNKCCYYLITDLVFSQRAQAKGDELYSFFLTELRTEITHNCLPDIKHEFLLLGEIGDAIKIAFADVNDAFLFLINLSNILSDQIFIDKFLTIRTELSTFPQLSAMLQKLPMPQNEQGDSILVTRVLGKTLSGSYDFNTIKLTEFYRLESSIKMNKEKLPEYNVYAWIFKNAAEEILLTNCVFNYYQLSPDKLKHNISLSDNITLVLFKNKEVIPIPNPEFFIKTE